MFPPVACASTRVHQRDATRVHVAESHKHRHVAVVEIVVEDDYTTRNSDNRANHPTRFGSVTNPEIGEEHSSAYPQIGVGNGATASGMRNGRFPIVPW